MAVDYGDEQGFIDLAMTSRLNLEATFAALDKVATEGAGPGASSTTATMLRSAGGDIRALARELLEKVEDVGQAIDRCDIFELVGNLIEVAFEIGGAVSKAQSLAELKKQIQSERGKASSDKKREEMTRWHDHCKQRFTIIYSANPTLNSNQITEKIINDWPSALPDREFDTIKALVTRLLDRPRGRPRKQPK